MSQADLDALRLFARDVLSCGPGAQLNGTWVYNLALECGLVTRGGPVRYTPTPRLSGHTDASADAATAGGAASAETEPPVATQTDAARTSEDRSACS